MALLAHKVATCALAIYGTALPMHLPSSRRQEPFIQKVGYNASR